MGLNAKITETFEITLTVSSQQIRKTIDDNKNNQGWTDKFGDNINYEEINVKNNRLEIIRKPGTLSAFRPSGKITIDIVDLPDNKTTLKCKILPYNGALPYRIVLLIVVLSIWSLLLLFFVDAIDALILICLALAVFGLIYYLTYLYAKNGLIQYSKNK